MTSADAGRPPLRPEVTVLYIDDNSANLRLVGRIFEREGDDVIVIPAMLGELGLKLARDRPDLILLDLNLPDMRGEDVLARLRGEPLTRDIPVVVLSADVSPGVAERLTGLGAQAFVSKPIAIADFLVVVARFLPRRPPVGTAEA